MRMSKGIDSWREPHNVIGRGLAGSSGRRLADATGSHHDERAQTEQQQRRTITAFERVHASPPDNITNNAIPTRLVYTFSLTDSPLLGAFGELPPTTRP
jgi:hypothetical protein